MIDDVYGNYYDDDMEDEIIPDYYDDDMEDEIIPKVSKKMIQ